MPCSLGDVETGARFIRWLHQCSRCGWVDPVLLDAWAEQAYKEQLDKQSQRIAMAIVGEPFTFVRSTEADVTIEEALGQALGAASMCWEHPEAAGEFNTERATRIYAQMMAFLGEKMQPLKVEPARFCVDCNHQHFLHRDGALGVGASCIGKGPGYACPCTRTCQEVAG
jgi:hypothetical protein